MNNNKTITKSIAELHNRIKKRYRINGKMINNNKQEEQNYWLALDMACDSVIPANLSLCRIIGIYV